jgi:hypothetical protein
MDRPTSENQPSRDLLAIYAIGPILSMTFNKDATDESLAEAEDRSHGCSFEYEAMIDLVGKTGSCTIGEIALGEHVELHVDINSHGGWALKYTSNKCCVEWLKWLKSEERDLTTYRRLKKKFAYLGEDT